MEIRVPPFNIRKTYDQCIRELIRAHVVQGVYKGYDLNSDVCCCILPGFSGWNLFINNNFDKDILKRCLQYLVKNKTALLFVMENTSVDQIYVKIK